MDTALSMLLVLLKATCVLLIALTVTVALARASAGSRHLVWLTAMAGLLALPLLARWSPIPLRVLPATAVPAETPSGSANPALPAPRREPESTASPPGHTVDRPASTPVLVSRFAFLGSSRWNLLLAVWAGVAVLLLAWLAVGAFQVRRIVRRAVLLDDRSWQEPLYEIADRMGLERAPVLLRSDDVMMPFAAGLLHPVVVLPEASDTWSAERRSAVLIHELAHVKRRDLVGHAMGRIACALYWFHPLVWTGARHLRAESERACDDLALEYGTRPSEYAEHLLDIVTCVRDHRTPAVALAMAHRKEFEGRMLAILNPELARKGLGRGRSLLLAGGVALLAVVVSAARPVARNQVLDTAAADKPAAEVAAVGAALAGDTAASVKVPTGTAAAAQRVHRAERTSTTVKQSTTQERPAAVPAPGAHAARVAPDSSDDERATVLARTLRTDPSAELRRISAWGLEKYARTAIASDALVAALTSDSDAEVREMSAWALADAQPTPAVLAALRKAAGQENDPKLRRTAVWALGSVGGDASAETLATLLGDKDAGIRELAAWGIGNANVSRAPAALTALLNDPNRDVREAAIYALFGIEDPGTARALEAAFEKEKDAELRLRIVRAIGATDDEGSVQVLQRLVSSSDAEVRKEAVTALAGASGHGVWVWPRPRPRPFP
jgi:beta-lactamase regulating signal transducer with metallopeptidase domain/HEAT repeat protein